MKRPRNSFRYLSTSFVIAFAFLIGDTTPSISDVAKSDVPIAQDFWQLEPGKRRDGRFVGVEVMELASALPSYSTIETTSSSEELTHKRWLCDSMDDSVCRNGTGGVIATLVLPPCYTSTDRMCIESLWLGTSPTNLEEARLERESPGPKTPADLPTKLPKGGTTSLWISESFPHHPGLHGYGVKLSMVLPQSRKPDGSRGDREAPFALSGTSMELSVVPVKFTPGDYYPKVVIKREFGMWFGTETNFLIQQDSDHFWENTGNPKYDECPTLDGNGVGSASDIAWIEKGFCAQPTDWAENSRVRLVLRMANELSGWLWGRMKDVKVEVTPIDKEFNRITIESSPISVPHARGLILKSDLLKNSNLTKEYIKRNGAITEFSSGNETEKIDVLNSDYYPGFISMIADTTYSVGEFTTWDSVLKASPIKSPERWELKSGAWSGTTNNSCFQDKTQLLGIVTSNAVAYSPGAPEFKDGSLNYKVAGVHYLEDGVTLNRGTYDLAIRTSVARCLYGFSNAPIKASISVIDAEGNEQTTSVESIKEDAKREWLFLSAQNFTFSSPTIKVKLTQDKKLSPGKTKTSKTATKTTITCAKGTISKKITGANPKCPAGYKKK